MNWKYAKTLFIAVFILVNLSLIVIYVDKVKKSHIHESKEENEVNFKQEQIDLPRDLPSVDGVKMQLLTARSNDFSSEGRRKTDESSVDDGARLKVDVKDHVPASEEDSEPLKNYVESSVYDGDHFRLNHIDSKQATFEQTYDGYPIMNNKKARLNFTLKDGKAERYTQSAMKTIEPSKGENNDMKQVISAKKALEALYYNQYLKRYDNVKLVRLGYYTVVREPNVQVLQANWEITVQHKDKIQTYYVEAISDNPKIIKE
ncbi:two-component system regulatory protein YycI [Staphylococcus sp. SQ8-PEA]|uniref:Two-component system regulatory protein YycI n=1 Tax=Staphylococcus marylandisciuri TaxID=2981529 RepID=A0ABT2QSZ4_9STAP|nr:two-component system regulatory protein YycI [Staphylococcus marylandisciuri]MCU5747097.1 two-component system regulatory protein YycI [Staphylococcus marylandisciuri]